MFEVGRFEELAQSGILVLASAEILRAAQHSRIAAAGCRLEAGSGIEVHSIVLYWRRLRDMLADTIEAIVTE